MPKSITIGPGWNEPFKDVVAETGCCTCCNKCSPDNAVGLDTCPSHCCPCPPTGDICLTFYDLGGNCGPLDGVTMQLTREAGIPYCSGENPEVIHAGELCYDPEMYTGCPVCPGEDWKNYTMSLNGWPHEKWAGSGTFCGSDAGGCGSGERITVSLCCCDNIGAANQGVFFEDDCHGCRYQLRFKWDTWENPPPGATWYDGDYCTCPVGYYEEKLIPPEYCATYGPEIFTWEMHKTECGSGNPDNWKTVFEIVSGVWNCSCCTGWDETEHVGCQGPTNVRIIATPLPPGETCG